MKRLLFLACLLATAPAFAAPYAIVDGSGNVVNVVEWDGKSNWMPPAGTTAVADPAGAPIGSTYAGGIFTPPAQPAPVTPPPPPPAPITAAEVAAILLQKGLIAPADVQPSAVSAAVAAQPVPMQPMATQ